MGGGNGIHREESHERTRVFVRVDEIPALPVAPTAPALHEPLAPGSPKTAGRKFAKGNPGRKLRQAKEQAQRVAASIAVVNPQGAPPWLRPHVESGQPYVVALLSTLGDRPALHPLAIDCASANVMYRASLALALQAEDVKTRAAMMTEARGWLREHRAALVALSALAGGMKLPEPDPHAAIARAVAEFEAK